MLLELGVPYSEGATSAYLHPTDNSNNDDDDDEHDDDGGQGKKGRERRDWGYCSAGAARALAEVRGYIL